MKKIKLTQGKYALVDNADFEWLNQWKWYVDHKKNGWYARKYLNGKTVYMHRLIMDLRTGDKREIDHINHNGLNNQQYNLRIVTHQQNAINNKGKGICWNKQIKRWIAYIKINRKFIHLGCFIKKSNAKKAREEALQARKRQMNLI